MTTVHVGLPAFHGDVGRYAQRFDLVEVRPVDAPLPKVSRLRQWRKDVPPAFVFSVVLPSIVSELRASPEVDKALRSALDASDALEARSIVIATPVHVTPTALHRKRLHALVEKLPRDVVTLAWEPRGVWDVDEAAALAKDMGVTLVVDATRDRPPRGAVMYTRLRGLGTSTRLAPAAIERVRDAMKGRREVFVVIESSTPRKIADALLKPLDGSPRMATAGVIRPQVRLSAEDEEQ
jgi:uncharacterized protein YecE (DUF72 family)